MPVPNRYHMVEAQREQCYLASVGWERPRTIQAAAVKAALSLLPLSDCVLRLADQRPRQTIGNQGGDHISVTVAQAAEE
jgi:hypothetical protein